MRSSRVVMTVALVTFTGLFLSIDAYAGSPLSPPGAPAAPPASADLKRYAGFPVNVGEVGPIAPNNPRQEPFACETQNTLLGQPVVDNQAGNGYPVTNASGNVIGYSADCGAPSIVEYYYLPAGSNLDAPLVPYDLNNPPKNVAKIDVGRRHNVPMIVRYEAGTINRFIYAIVVITPHPSKNLNRVDRSAWNHDLLFILGGGVGIGHDQASGGYALSFVQEGANGNLMSPTPNTDFFQEGQALLESGYALISSTGNVTATDYNLRLTGQTAVMVKEQFISRYGHPRFTFAAGASGGAIQQYVFAQDFPGLLDGLVTFEPYPDMITQINPVGDCELLEFYFDQSNTYYNNGAQDPFWNSWTNRQLIEGMAGINGFQSAYAPPGGSIPWSPAQMGSDACIEAWLGATPEVLNPWWPVINPDNLAASQMAGTYWDYFDDLKGIFGVNPANGFAYNTYDNVGVQYGLLSLTRGEITPTEFLNINAGVGGWQKSWEMSPPGEPFQSASFFDVWSYLNANDVASPGFTGIAPRTVGDLSALQAAYRSGLVFLGAVNLPIIDIMQYLEPELNMHASRENFAIRKRLIEARGNADNQIIWSIPNIPGVPSPAIVSLLPNALDIETRWLLTHKRPKDAMDACYTQGGTLIAQGPNVWNGQMNGAMDGNPSDDPSPGPCTQQFPIYSSSRLLAGDALSERTFKCALKPVSVALTDGTYGSVTFTSAQVTFLGQIFPTGVCDYTQPDLGRPDLPLPALLRVIHAYKSE